MPLTVSPPPKRWRLLDDAGPQARDLCETLGLHPAIGMLLVRRGVRTASQALEFLSPGIDNLHDPLLLPDAGAAVDRIAFAIEKGQPIFVHGDYDVDGVTSAALYTRVLRRLGANVTAFVPSRSRDGYGVRPQNVEMAHADGAGLILTCDCGISAHDACERARELGLDLIITDHHEPPEDLPCAFAVVNPMLRHSAYPFRPLAGVGVSYKICQALCARNGIALKHLHKHFLDLVALGTVSDVAPLLGENRAYVFHGLRSILRTRKAGLRALLRVSGVDPSRIETDDIGFRLGPRINAAGRLAEASEALELLMTPDEGRAAEIAGALTLRNEERQAEQQRVYLEALAVMENDGRLEDQVLVISGDGWHPGVIGIVAGKLAETFWRPAFVVVERDGRFHGSGRSIPGFPLANAIQDLGPDLVLGGGHAMAAGISFEGGRLADVRSALCALAHEWLTEEQLTPCLDIDLEIDPHDLSFELACELARLAPFGESNPEPILMSSGVLLRDVRAVGSGGQHFRAEIDGCGRERLCVIGFGMGESAAVASPSDRYRICYNLRVDRFNGQRRAQLVLADEPQKEI